MRQENVKVIIWGLGAMGKGMAEMLLEKTGIEITGVVGRGAKLGQSMFAYLDKANPYAHDVLIGTPEEVITEAAADVVLVCTDSYTGMPSIKLNSF